MKKFLLVLVFTFFAIINSVYSQIVINELDADSPSTDILEFIELKSTLPNFSLDGYCLVFYNGSSTGLTTFSYYALDLDGYITDVNGIIHFGNSQVSPTPALVIPNTTIQNGPDGVALYQGDAYDFPNNTVAHTNGLIDFLLYTNSTTVQTTGLMSVFGTSVCINENQTSLASTKSIQRKMDGTYEVKTPTPGMNNDGSGVVLNYLSMATNATTVTEGEALNITFTASQPVTGTDLIINFSLNNGAFDVNDFAGTSSIVIPVGATSGSSSIQVLNDGTNEGDEEMKIVIGTIPSGYSLYINNIIIRVNDINFTTLSFGKPSTPSYGLVTSSAPLGYYSSLEGLSGASLKQAVQNIISNPAVVHAHNYGDIVEILKHADQNPENSNQVYLIYTEQPRSKIDYQTTNSIIGKWNREHIYCQSRGNFGNLYNVSSDGINLWSTTGPDDIGAGLADAHHIRAVDGQENSSRNNRNYGSDYNGPIGSTLNTWKGDVARACFYMAVRYNGLNVVNGNPIDGTIGQIGDLATLLTWNYLDPSDDFEMNRNNYIYTWQVNRNPFIDYPNLADYIFGANYGQPWFSTLSNNKFSELNVVFYPNPAHEFLTISGLDNDANIEFYSILGTKIWEQKFSNETTIDLRNFEAGIYIAKVISNNKVIQKKIIID